MILERTWIATIDALIGCRIGGMTISNGHSIKKISLHPPTKPIENNLVWLEVLYDNQDEYSLHPILKIG